MTVARLELELPQAELWGWVEFHKMQAEAQKQAMEKAKSGSKGGRHK